MPVGRVFNATQNQILISPVSSYYRGKAIRQQLKAGETDIEYKKTLTEKYRQEIDDAPARKAAAEKMAAANYALVLEHLREKILANGTEEIAQARDVVGPWVQEYGKRSKNNPASGLEWANKNFAGMIERLPRDKQDEYLKVAGPDRVLDFDEMSKLGLMIQAYQAEEDPDPTAHQQVLDDLVERKFITEEQRNQTLLDIETKAGDIPGEGGGIKTADQSFMLRMVGQHFGALFERGPDGELIPKFMDPTRQRRASEITSLAANLLQDGAASNAADAVKRAMKAYGQKWEEPGENDEIPESDRLEIIAAYKVVHGDKEPTEEIIAQMYKDAQ